ncbi:alpha/beta hydrolase family protein [Paludibaculum fermentans]|uniref:Alpha/beta fold hydrolase n=1 Tax=Paludibaculum fermentans TaxID=1473598 RepID=A0A7S7NWG3_PALFE|nr:alpha/beta fold hydrolase [Paludibaculum fermentans]QOY91020.1 alpha/beta fold hydrolase [Paludibaculum fermentans]
MCLFRHAALIVLTCLAAVGQTGIEGSWEGPVQTQRGQVRLRVHVTKAADGSLSAKMDVPEQGAFGLALNSVTFAEGVFHWEMKAINASFDGKMAEAGSEISGTFKQGSEQPLAMKRIQAPAGRPQDPKPPLPYKSEDVAFPSKAEGVTLAGTLTLPQGKGPFPAAILITGSGPQDRDEALMGHRPFLVLSDYLTRHGIAVLRYDDRGVGKSTGTFANSTTTDFSRDAEGALDYLRKRPELNPARIGLVGHSEGGIIAPMVAARRPEAAFVVLMAGTGVPGAEVMLLQAERLNAAAGVAKEVTDQNTALQKKIFAILREEKDDQAAQDKLKEALAGIPGVEAQARGFLSPWMREFASYDPAPTLQKLRCPVLVLNGEKDLQVIADQNVPPIEAALKKGGNKDFRIVRLPGLNHLFQNAKTGLVQEYGQIDETLAPVFLETMTTWIRRHTGLEK